MPIYEYRCSSCGHQQEFLQKVSDAPQTVCTACGKPTFSKMLTAAGFQLKGSGWYATDFRNKGAAPAKSTEASGESKAQAKTEGKSDAKPEAKSETKTETKAAPATPAKTP
jgi:putative FmdB family regulatory protein